MKKYTFILFLCGSFACTGKHEAADEVKIYLNPVNKTAFQQYGPIILDVVVENKSSKDISICNIEWDFFNTDLNVNVRYIDRYISNGMFVITSSHGIKPNITEHAQPRENIGCDTKLDTRQGGYYKTIVPAHTTIHIPKLVAATYYYNPTLGGVRTLGVFPRIPFLPSGNYEFTFFIYKENTETLTLKSTFKIIDTDVLLRQHMQEFTEVFHKEIYKKRDEHIELKDKNTYPTEVLTFYRKTDYNLKQYKDIFFFHMAMDERGSYYFPITKPNLDFFVQEIFNVKDEYMQMYMWREFVKEWNTSVKTGWDLIPFNRLELYKDIIRKLKGSNPKMAEIFFNYVVSWLGYENIYTISPSGFYPDKPLSKEDVEELRQLMK